MLFNLDKNIYLRPKGNTELTFVGKTKQLFDRQVQYNMYEAVLQTYTVIFSLTDPKDSLTDVELALQKYLTEAGLWWGDHGAAEDLFHTAGCFDASLSFFKLFGKRKNDQPDI